MEKAAHGVDGDIHHERGERHPAEHLRQALQPAGRREVREQPLDALKVEQAVSVKQLKNVQRQRAEYYRRGSQNSPGMYAGIHETGAWGGAAGREKLSSQREAYRPAGSPQTAQKRAPSLSLEPQFPQKFCIDIRLRSGSGKQLFRLFIPVHGERAPYTAVGQKQHEEQNSMNASEEMT